MLMAEMLGVMQRCVDSVVSRASSADPALFGWPVSDATTASKQVLWNGIDGAGRRKVGASHDDSWIEDLVLLRLPLFKRLILAMKTAELSPEIIETCVMYYAKKYIPGVSRSNRKSLPLPSPSSSVAIERSRRSFWRRWFQVFRFRRVRRPQQRRGFFRIVMNNEYTEHKLLLESKGVALKWDRD